MSVVDNFDKVPPLLEFKKEHIYRITIIQRRKKNPDSKKSSKVKKMPPCYAAIDVRFVDVIVR
jgi:hypothetical protein